MWHKKQVEQTTIEINCTFHAGQYCERLVRLVTDGVLRQRDNGDDVLLQFELRYRGDGAEDCRSAALVEVHVYSKVRVFQPRRAESTEVTRLAA